MGRKHLVSGAIGFLFGAAVAILFILSIRPRYTTWPVIVGDASAPDDPSRVAPPDLTIHWADHVKWQAFQAGRPLLIEFTEPIFQNMKKQANGRYQVLCLGDECNSDAVSSTAKPGVWYKYWQGLGDPQSPTSPVKWADGRIIIVRP